MALQSRGCSTPSNVTDEETLGTWYRPKTNNVSHLESTFMVLCIFPHITIAVPAKISSLFSFFHSSPHGVASNAKCQLFLKSFSLLWPQAAGCCVYCNSSQQTTASLVHSCCGLLRFRGGRFFTGKHDKTTGVSKTTENNDLNHTGTCGQSTRLARQI